jgi:hypothetical protein
MNTPNEPNEILDKQGLPNYKVKLWEVVGVGILGILLVALALLEVVNQFFTKIQNPAQAESIARTVVDYQLPGGNQGLKSFETKAESFALVGNRRNPPDLLMLVTQALIEPDRVENQRPFTEELDITTALVGSWRKAKQSTQQKQFCGQRVSVTVRQGSYLLVESPRQSVAMTEYLVMHNRKKSQTSIQLFAIGPQAAAELDQVLQSLKCREEP